MPESRVFVREIEPGVELFRDAVTGIAWAEDHRVGSVEGMVARGWWMASDRVVRSHGWIYNIDRFSCDDGDPIEAIVAEECMCPACIERRARQGERKQYVCPVCHNAEHLPGAKFCMICGTAFPLSNQEEA